MAKIVPLNSSNHKDLKISPNCVMNVVRDQHIVNIRVAEISRASACMPVFLNKYAGSDNWAISSITSLEVKKNLFVIDDTWTVNYVPNVMRTYPFFLVASQKEGDFTVGIDEEDKAFNKKEGVNIFDENGKSTPAMESVMKLLETDVAGQAHTKKFVETLQAFGLIYSLTMRVKYQDGQVNSVTGLKSINEKKLQELNDDEFIKLRKTGFLGPIYALILSVFQLNELMKRHNKLPGVKQILQVSMQPENDESKPAEEIKTTAKKVTKKKQSTPSPTETKTEVAKKNAIEAAKKKAVEASKTKTHVKAKRVTKATVAKTTQKVVTKK